MTRAVARPSGNAWIGRKAPGLDDFAEIAETVFAELPEGFRGLAGETHLRIAEFAEDDVLADLGAESPFDILGLFQGVGMAHDAAAPQTGQLPNMIWLYRRPILDYWSEHDETLDGLIRHVLVHEIGHHFGLSDDDMEAIEAVAAAEGE